MEKLQTRLVLFFISITLGLPLIVAQSISKDQTQGYVSGLKFREIGPSVMGGRISDIAVNPDDKNIWYVAAGSGNLWKSTNRGLTWVPIFDNQSSYSIGTVAIDPNNPSVIWVGSGENVSGRHVAWGDGVYKSLDAGKSWTNMGLKSSEHIGKVLIDPTNSDVVFVAAEGPLWSSGGERGLYKTVDGGSTWKRVLEIDENTGVTDIEFDPSNPNTLYAAAYERRRKTWSLLAGGSKSGIYKSTDNGESWKRLTNGLPATAMGKIGLAVTAADSRRVYATIESDSKNKGFYRSDDGGESWSKQNSYTSGGTGPHYYQEIEASQSDPDLVYQMDVFLKVTRDGGKSFNYLETARDKHSDNHALWIDPEDGRHLIGGTDGGLYESFDEGTTWRHFPNLPISQFYKISLDNSEPYYNVVAGAQDLGTLLGPIGTTNTEGIRNQDWYIPLGADGYDCAFDPDDPNIVYMEIQQGILNRLDRRTEEVIGIKPQPAENDPPERWNWDSPLLVSPHDSKTIYFGSQRLWKSVNRGDSWEAVSADLTTNTNRYQLKMKENVPSVDDLYDNGAMSKYSTLTCISESPLVKGLLYTGSDDGLIHISENDGESWTKSKSLSGVPQRSFINDIEASQHDTNTVFVVVDAHKLGDYRPLIFSSKDRGNSWSSMAGDLPNGTIVWSIKQDYVDPNLIFIGTEYGVYFTLNKGVNWVKLESGIPTIAIRDIELHPRDFDLVGGSFGRGIFVLDDYTPLRKMNSVVSDKQNTLLPVRDAWWYIPNTPMQANGMPSQGSTAYKGENPEYGALISIYIADVPQSMKEKRADTEKSFKEKNEDVPFPGWDRLREEAKELEASFMILISDEQDQPIRWLPVTAKKGLNRVGWDLKLPAPDPVSLSEPAFKPPWVGSPEGPMVAPGRYQAQLYLNSNGDLISQGMKQSFEVKPIPSLRSADLTTVADFKRNTANLSKKIAATSQVLRDYDERLKYIQVALVSTPEAGKELFKTYKTISDRLFDLKKRLMGDPVLGSKDEDEVPSIASRVWHVVYGHSGSSNPPTETFERNIEIAESNYEKLTGDLKSFKADFTAFQKRLVESGAPYTPGSNFD